MDPMENYLDSRTDDRLLRYYANTLSNKGYENLMLKYDDRNKKIKQWMMAANMYGHGKPEVYQMFIANLGKLLQRDYNVLPQDVGRVIEEAGVGFKNTSNPPSDYRPSEEIFSKQAYQDIDPVTKRIYDNRFYTGDFGIAANELANHFEKSRIGNAYRSGINTIENYAKGVRNSSWNPMNWRDPEGYKFSEIFPNEFGGYPK